jgi:hypothetical protein
MRFLTIALASALLSLPAVTPADACGAAKPLAEATTATYSADEKKPAKKAAMVKKAPKKKFAKVEYMRAVPVAPPK